MNYKSDEVESVSSENKDFWSAYRDVVLKDGIPEKIIKWYINWTKQFAHFMRGKHLRQCTAADVKSFLNHIREQNNVEPWQVKQAAKALKLLYQDFLQVPWALLQKSDFSSEESGTMSDGGLSGSASQGQQPFVIFRDEAPPKEIYYKYEDVFKKLRTEIRFRHYSIRTEQAYEQWVCRFLHFHSMKPVEEIVSNDVKVYLDYLAENRKVAASTQNQALNALVFLFEQALNQKVGTIGDFTRAKRPKRLPVVLTREEVNLLLDALTGTYALMAGLLYGSGLRLMECVRLRVKDLDFAQNQIVVRDGKGQKDRVTMLPERFQPRLREHLARAKEQHNKDITEGRGAVYLWPSMERKYPNAAREWIWQYVFPSDRLSVDPRSQKVRRHHIHENGLQRAVKDAAWKVGLTKQMSCHALRHSFATHPPGRWLRYPHCAGTAWTCRCLYDHDLYSCAKQAGTIGEKPCRPVAKYIFGNSSAIPTCQNIFISYG